MDFSIHKAFAVLFALLSDPILRKRFYPQLAKLYHKILRLSLSDENLAVEMDRQSLKEPAI